MKIVGDLQACITEDGNVAFVMTDEFGAETEVFTSPALAKAFAEETIKCADLAAAGGVVH